MKIALFLALAISLPAYANKEESVFRQGTKMPGEHQWAVIAAVEKACAKGVSYYSLTEENTLEEMEEIDQGVRDYVYTTTLKTTYNFDGYHPTFAYITVKSRQNDVTAPGTIRFEILEITSDAGICAKD